jgi:hypothetical protein
MPGGVLVIAALLGSASGGVVVEMRSEAEVRSPEIRLADVADLAGVPDGIRRRAAPALVARFGRGQQAVRLSWMEVVERARATVPAIAQWLPTDPAGTVTVLFRPDPAGTPGRRKNCLQALADLEPGAIPLRGDFEPARCEGDGPASAFAYDRRSGTVRAARPVLKGELVEAPPPSAFADVRPGAEVTLTSQLGPVTIRRRVTITQPGRKGAPVFVRAGDGKPFAVTLGEAGR